MRRASRRQVARPTRPYNGGHQLGWLVEDGEEIGSVDLKGVAESMTLYRAVRKA